MNTFTMLLKREFWEHRSLWIAPLVWVGILVLLSAWVLFVLGHGSDMNHPIDGNGRDIFTMSYLVISGLITSFTTIVVFFYLIDCLFTERKDRSILFWKSLPISDAQVVLSKMAVAMVVMPLGVLALTAVTQVTISGLVWLRISGTGLAAVMSDWTFSNWLRSLVVDFSMMVAGVLWYAPIAAYFLLLSVWARKVVFLWAVIPFIAVPSLEFLFFRSNYVGEFLHDRFMGYVHLMKLKPMRFDGQGPNVQEVFDSMSISGVLTSPQLWLGLLAAAGLLYLTIYIRRHRDET